MVPSDFGVEGMPIHTSVQALDPFQVDVSNLGLTRTAWDAILAGYLEPTNNICNFA